MDGPIRTDGKTPHLGSVERRKTFVRLTNEYRNLTTITVCLSGVVYNELLTYIGHSLKKSHYGRIKLINPSIHYTLTSDSEDDKIICGPEQ